MNGILVIDKQKGYTSRDIVNIVGKKLNTRKVGHTGTLDPMATGVLVLCIGNSLKLVELLTSDIKEYEARIVLGYETDTLDSSGKIVKESSNKKIVREDIEKVLSKFIGNICQEVPMYSAVRVNGKRLYKYARSNEEVEIPKRMVNIYELVLISDIDNINGRYEFSFRCKVSKGTYIRSLIRDIGIDLGTYGCMLELRRLKQGIFDIDMAYSLEDIENNKYKLLNPVDILDMEKVIVDSDMEFRIKNGQKVNKFFNGNMAMILNKDNKMLAIYKDVEDDDTMVKPFKMFNC